MLHGQPSWTDERIDLLKKFFNDGLSSSQIGKELGVTRNAIIGKCARLGLSGQKKTPQSVTGVKRKQRRQSQKLITMKKKPPVPSQDVRAPVEYEMDPEPSDQSEFTDIVPRSQRCTLMQLTEGKCRWPIGDPASEDFFFCGGKTMGKLPYCAHHARIAYQPLGGMRRRYVF